MTNSSQPGVVREFATGGNTCGNLTLPPTVIEVLEGAALRRANMILLEYARDAALLQSRAYEAVLTVISEAGDGRDA